VPAKFRHAFHIREFGYPANLLTIVRLLMLPAVVRSMRQPDGRWRALGVLAIAMLTDALDGPIARRRHEVSLLGKALDPIADKIMVAAVIVMLIASRKANGEPPIIQDWNVIPALIILLREIIVSGLREFLAGLQVSVPVSALAKWKTTFQLVALGALILGGALPEQPWVHMVGLVSLWAAAALTLITGYDYLRTGLRHMD
jgi:CDP-diacylglycerol--glycerol-3-phosphate 3-phosphatidyltransferase